MKFFKIFLTIVLSILGLASNTFSQSRKVYSNIFKEDFSSNTNDWSINNIPQYQTFISNSNKYICNHPLDTHFGFTRVPTPNVLNKINDGENSSLSFNFDILNTPSDGNFSFGLIFDWHKTSDVACAQSEDNGGDFYLIHIYGNLKTNNISANVLQRENCAYTELIKHNRDGKYNQSSNLIEIERNGSTYDIIINGIVVTSFVYDAKCIFNDIYFERGEYAFDNLSISKIDYLFSSEEGFAQTNLSDKRPNIYILLAGINNYDNPSYHVGNLSGPIKDITAMKKFYSSIRGGAIQNANIIFLPNDKATADNILRSASELFSKANQNDVIITYLSGHGGVGYFCAYDQGLQYERLNMIINKSPARKVFIVDACHAGSWDASSVMTSKGEKLTEQQALELFYKQLTNSGNGINWLLACRPDEYSADGRNNGLFTEFLLSGLKGAADKEGNNDNIVSLDELYIYVKNRFNDFNNQHQGQFWNNTNVPLKMNPILKSSSGNTNIPMAVTF